MTRISPIFAVAATATDAAASDFQTDVIGDGVGLEDEYGEGALTLAVVDEDVTLPSSWAPPPDMVSTFDSLVGISLDTWGESYCLRLSTTSVVRHWTAPDSGFRLFRRDPSLHVPFEKFAKDKPFYDFGLSTMGSSFAAAHSSMHAAAFIEEFLQRLPTVLEGPFWAKWCVDVAHAFQADVLLPLRDSARCSSGSVGSSVMAVKTMVVKSAEVAIQPVLRTSPPSAGYFFGDPATQVSTSLNLLIKEKRPAAKHPAAAAPQAAAASAYSASTSTDSKGKGFGRNSRGRVAARNDSTARPQFGLLSKTASWRCHWTRAGASTSKDGCIRVSGPLLRMPQSISM